MKFIINYLIIFSFLNLYSSYNNIPINQQNDSTTLSPCWFVNKNDQYPFQNLNMAEFFPPLNSKTGNNFYAVGAYVLFPAVECVVRLGCNLSIAPMLPFFIINTLSIISHTIYLQNKFQEIIENFTHEDLYLTDSEKIKEYLIPIQQFNGKFGSICECDNKLKILSKQSTNSSSDCTEQDYKFMPIEIPEHIRKNIITKTTKTALNNREYIYSAIMTALFIYWTSAFFYKSLTVPLNMKTFGRMGIMILYNWLFLYAENKKHQDHLISNVHTIYQDFVIRVHNYPISVLNYSNYISLNFELKRILSNVQKNFDNPD